jgi:hypothetical protein
VSKQLHQECSGIRLKDWLTKLIDTAILAVVEPKNANELFYTEKHSRSHRDVIKMRPQRVSAVRFDNAGQREMPFC